MRQFKVDDHVRLTRDIPELWLRHGESGVVCSSWSDPTLAFEVEFHHTVCGEVVRALVTPDELEEDEHSPFDDPSFSGLSD